MRRDARIPWKMMLSMVEQRYCISKNRNTMAAQSSHFLFLLMFGTLNISSTLNVCCVPLFILFCTFMCINHAMDRGDGWRATGNRQQEGKSPLYQQYHPFESDRVYPIYIQRYE